MKIRGEVTKTLFSPKLPQGICARVHLGRNEDEVVPHLLYCPGMHMKVKRPEETVLRFLKRQSLAPATEETLQALKTNPRLRGELKRLNYPDNAELVIPGPSLCVIKPQTIIVCVELHQK